MIISKKTNIKDLKKLKQCQNKNISQLFNDNQLNVYLLNQFIDINSCFNRKFIVKSKAKSDNKDVNKTDLFLALLVIKKEA